MATDEAARQRRRRARAQAKAAMAEVARARRTMTYSQLVERITASRYAPNGSPLADLLCEISRASYADRQIMLSAVVVREADGIPGDGFFELAGELGEQVSSREAFAKEALERSTAPRALRERWGRWGRFDTALRGQ